MQAETGHRNRSSSHIGQRRGISCLARLALDLTLASPSLEEESRTAAARSRAYPSPPMSAPLQPPSKLNQDADDACRGHGEYPPVGPPQPRGMYSDGTNTATTASMDPTRAIKHGPLPHSLPPLPHSLLPPSPYSSVGSRCRSSPYSHNHPFPLETTTSTQPSSGPQRFVQYHSPQEDPDAVPLTPYTLPPPQQQLQPAGLVPGLLQQTQRGSLSLARAPHGQTYAATAGSNDPEVMSLAMRSQRKAKGHVASACVPCKKAHLRCDAQRPCTRCIGNGKEHSCVDVQHKKRGRPRLRENAYDQAEVLLQQKDLSRPLGQYSTTESARGSGQVAIISAPRYGDRLRSRQYRVFKSHAGGRPGPRFLEQALTSDSGVGSPPQPRATAMQVQEPVAYLNMQLEIARASQAFVNALPLGGDGSRIMGRNLASLVVATDRDRVLSLQRRMAEVKSQLEPHYLPPIHSREQAEQATLSLGFGTEEVSRFHFDHDEILSFTVPPDERRPRPLRVRVGVVKRGSIFFVVLWAVPDSPISNHSRPFPLEFPAPSAYVREREALDPLYSQHQHQHRSPRQQTVPLQVSQPLQHHQKAMVFAQHSPSVPIAFEARRPLTHETTALSPRQPILNIGSGGLGSGAAYSPSPSRPDYPAGMAAFQIPRSEMGPATNLSTTQSTVQLPPIRTSPQPPRAAAASSSWPRAGRFTRLDIKGLIEQSDQHLPP